MVGAICLDKFIDGDGNPAPVTFHVKMVRNGSQPWQGSNSGNLTLSSGHASLEDAIRELHSKFLLEMEDKCTWFENGEVLDYDYRGNPVYFEGSSGWYSNYEDQSEPEYDDDGYPQDIDEWLQAGKTSFEYDNYTVMIVTSNGDQVY